MPKRGGTAPFEKEPTTNASEEKATERRWCQFGGERRGLQDSADEKERRGREGGTGKREQGAAGQCACQQGKARELNGDAPRLAPRALVAESGAKP